MIRLRCFGPRTDLAWQATANSDTAYPPSRRAPERHCAKPRGGGPDHRLRRGCARRTRAHVQRQRPAAAAAAPAAAACALACADARPGARLAKLADGWMDGWMMDLEPPTGGRGPAAPNTPRGRPKGPCESSLNRGRSGVPV
eukprot:scaffold1106_cov608-Prasinococcus_capsulatus_cf.AAC.23